MEKQAQLQSGTMVNQGLQLFNTVQNRLSNLNVTKIIKQLSDKINDNNYELDENEFEVLGGISYLLGLDFHNMNVWNNKVMTNVVIRLNMNNISYINLLNYTQILKQIQSTNNFKVISDVKNNLMNKIKSNVEFKSSKVLTIIRDILNNSLIPIEYTEDVSNRFLNNDTLIYHDLIVFNSLVYQNLITNGRSGELFVELSKNKEYVLALDKASNYFELQKFALFYEESILNFYSKNIENIDINFVPDFFETFLTTEYQEKLNKEYSKEEQEQIFGELENVIDNYYQKFVKTIELQNPVKTNEVQPVTEETVEKTPLNHSIETIESNLDNPLDNPTEVIKHILYDYNKIRNEQNQSVFDFKNDPTELISLVESMLENEDIVSPFYVFLTKYNEVKTTIQNSVSIDISKIFNYSLDSFNEAFKSRLQFLQDKYKEIIEQYISDVDSKKLVNILPKLNNILRSLYIGNEEDKGIIYSQLSENTIFTNKHLHQLITVIETQYISGTDVSKYLTFKSDFEEKYPEIITLFEESQQLELIELQIKLNYIFHKVFN